MMSYNYVVSICYSHIFKASILILLERIFKDEYCIVGKLRLSILALFLTPVVQERGVLLVRGEKHGVSAGFLDILGGGSLCAAGS